MNIPPGYHGIFVLCSYRCSLLVRQPMCKPGIWAMNHSFSYSNNKLVTRRPVNVKVGVVLTWVAKGGFNSIATEEQELHQPGCYKPSCSSHTHHLLCYCFTHSFSSLVSFLQKPKAFCFMVRVGDDRFVCYCKRWVNKPTSRPKRLITLLLC